MYTVKELLKTANETQAEIDGKWVPARPMAEPFVCRLRDAWKVLTGKADAMKWPGGQ